MTMIKEADGSMTCPNCDANFKNGINYGELLERKAIGERCDVCTTLKLTFLTPQEWVEREKKEIK